MQVYQRMYLVVSLLDTLYTAVADDPPWLAPSHRQHPGSITYHRECDVE